MTLSAERRLKVCRTMRIVTYSRNFGERIGLQPASARGRVVSARSDVFSPAQSEWMNALTELPHDIYHRPEYHSLSGLGHEGSPHLFVYREGGASIFVWPYLLRPIPGTDLNDVSSVYGYAGPLCQGDAEFVQRAWRALGAGWREQRVVAAFTRFHPLLGNAGLMANLAQVDAAAAEGLVPSGSTVSIDLTLPSGEQIKRYQKVLRQEVRKSRELGFVTVEDRDWEHVSSFVRVYRQTMERRTSRAEYLVDEAWVDRFRTALGSYARLFTVHWQGKVAAALLAIEYPPYLHAHLTGIDGEFAAHSPLKILLDDIREWGTLRGLHSFHLGGGLGGKEDSLFQFKRRFSPVTHSFQTGRWILDESRYRDLEAAHRESLQSRQYRLGNPLYFPSYRYQPAEADAIVGDAEAAAQTVNTA
jgi:hypothetical protein